MNPNVNAFITWFAGGYKQWLQAYDDKKITLQEILTFLPMAMMVADLAAKADEAWAEIKNSDTTKIVSTLDHLDQELAYLKPETRANIRNIAGAIMFGAAAVSGFKSTAQITDGEPSAD